MFTNYIIESSSSKINLFILDQDLDLEEAAKEEMLEDEPAEDVERATRANRLRRRQLTSQRIAHSIDTALDVHNYNPFELPNENRTIEGIVKVDRNKNNDIHYKFDNHPTAAQTGRTNQANVIRGRQGVSPVARDTRDYREAFEHFITADMIHNLVNFTNMKIEKLLAELPDDFDKTKYPFIKITVPSELSAFIGLFVYRGLYKLNTIN